MRDLLYFMPDPEVPDSELLGYGDLVYSDGTTSYLPGDPEIAMGLPKPPPGVSPQGSLGMGPPAPQMPPPVDLGDGMQVDATGNILQNGRALMQPELDAGFQPMQPIDPSANPNVQPAGPNVQQGTSFRPEGTLPGLGAAPAGGMGGGAPSMPPPVDIGEGLQIDATGNILQGGQPVMGGQGGGGMGPGGMMPVERQGALPADVAQRQLGSLDASQQQTLMLTEQARRDEARMMAQMTMQQLAANEAERISREQDIAEQQAKVQRWQQEQQSLIDMDIETDLISARGEVGGVFAAIGAALLGAAGNDTGFRMIESSIDRHVRQQVARRDTKLGILSQQIGSSMQAVSLGKAALYKVAADRTEILAQKTKNDVYEAQTPAVIQQLRQKQLENLQAAEQQSMGKLIERPALPPKPPSAEMLQKYGETRRERDTSVSIAQRAEREIGLQWVPGRNGEPGHYQDSSGRPVTPDNIDDIGIQGIGSLEQWVPDFVYSTMGGMTAEGYQVRGAAEAMAYAQIRQMQPTGPISNADIQAAVKAGALNTEDGMLKALTRIRLGAEQQSQSDAAQYGPDVVGEYERRMRGSGADPNTAPTASRRPTIEAARAGAAALRSQQGPKAVEADTPAEPTERMAMLNESLTALSQEKGLPPEAVSILMAQAGHETGDGKHMPQNNFFGMKSSTRNRASGAGSANLETTEGAGSAAQRVRQDFATFDTPAASAADMLSLLERRYPRAVEALQVGDVDAYVAALKDGNYFTGNESLYANALRRRL
jgi:flagellum-specific peptidoglycan hydrolase FlgJ